MISIGFRAAVAATAFVSVLVPVLADDKSASNSTLCRIVWDEDTTGGDIVKTYAELAVTQTLPQPDGGLVVFGSGTGTVTYKPKLPNCHVVEGSPWTANFTTFIMSADGKTAEVSIASMDEPHQITESCGQATFDVDPSELNGVTVPLKEGVTSYKYENGAGAYRGGASGHVALHYCSP
jgi:hypothetical protein